MRFLGMVCAVLLLVSPAAIAHAKDPDSLVSSKSSTPAKKGELTAQEQFFTSAWRSVEKKKANSFAAKVVLTSQRGEVTVLSMDQRQAVGPFLAKQGIQSEDYRTDRGRKLDKTLKPEHRTAIFLFKVNFKNNFSTIAIPAPIRTIESSALPADTEMVLDEGYDGEALQTTVETKSISNSKKLNRKARKKGVTIPVSSTKVETITVVRAPSPKIVLVGTNASDEIEGTPLELLYPMAEPAVTSSYGMRDHPVLHVYKLHDGVDFDAACGEPVMAATGGVVDFTGMLTGYGNQVELDHGAGFTTSYSHLTEWLVEEGDAVEAGEVIGLAGTTGYSTGCHLHFMTLINDEPIDPMGILNR